MTSIDDPENLRSRATEMRSRANVAILEETKKGLLRIAGDFDVLAERAEKRQAVYARLRSTESADLGAGDQPKAEEGTAVR